MTFEGNLSYALYLVSVGFKSHFCSFSLFVTIFDSTTIYLLFRRLDGDINGRQSDGAWFTTWKQVTCM